MPGKRGRKYPNVFCITISISKTVVRQNCFLYAPIFKQFWHWRIKYFLLSVQVEISRFFCIFVETTAICIEFQKILPKISWKKPAGVRSFRAYIEHTILASLIVWSARALRYQPWLNNLKPNYPKGPPAACSAVAEYLKPNYLKGPPAIRTGCPPASENR